MYIYYMSLTQGIVYYYQCNERRRFFKTHPVYIHVLVNNEHFDLVGNTSLQQMAIQEYQCRI